MSNYTSLHCHSNASILDGYSPPSRIAKRITEIGMDGAALTDHGNISNSISFLKEMEKVDKKPIIGMEAYVCQEHASIKSKENRKLSHLVLLAKNTKGWKTLVKIVSESNKAEHFYHKPRLSLEQLNEFLDGNIIAFSGHLGSCISNDICGEYGIKAATKKALLLEKMFGKGNFWLECQLMDRVNTPEQIEVTKVVREISKITGIKCLATADAHYSYEEDAVLQRIMLCSNMNVSLKEGRDPNFQLNTFFNSTKFHIPSYDEMVSYGHTKEELENTNVVLGKIEKYEILRAPMMGKFECPDGFEPDEYLRELCRRGWKKLIEKQVHKSKHQVYVDRIKTELDVFEGAGLSSYFLIIADILDYVRDQEWLSSPARGSAAGCLVSYLVGITQIDPIKHDLLFSRFFSSGRIKKTINFKELTYKKYLERTNG